MAAADTSVAQNVVPPAADAWALVADVPCQLSVEVPLPDFRLGDLAALEPKSVVSTRWTLSNDVPLRVNGQLLAWCEFEISEGRLAVRLTELA